MTTTTPSRDIDATFTTLAKMLALGIELDSADAVDGRAKLQGQRLRLAILEELRVPFTRLYEQQANQPTIAGTPITPEAEALVNQFAPAFERLVQRLATTIAEREDQAILRVACLNLLSDVLVRVLYGLPADAMISCDNSLAPV